MSNSAVVRVPTENVADESVFLARVAIKNGEWVEKGATICEIETSKALVEIEAPISGFVSINYEMDDEIPVGEVIALINDSKEESSKGGIGGSKADVTDEVGSECIKTIFSKKALELLRENGIAEDSFAGRDFVRKTDVLKYLGIKETSAVQNVHPKPLERAAPTPRGGKLPSNISKEKLPAHKLIEIQHLSNSQNILTSNFAVKVKFPVAPSSGSGSAPFSRLKNKLTPIILKCVCQVLKEFREVNAFFHENHVCYYKDVNLGYALDLGEGLKVVGLGDLSDKTLDEINKLILDYARMYLRKKLTAECLTGSTFTVTDLSGDSVLSFSPLINKNQSAVLGISSIDEDDGCFILNLVFDHRVSEGKQSAQYLNKLKKKIIESIILE